jgi:hypothetical protein
MGPALRSHLVKTLLLALGWGLALGALTVVAAAGSDCASKRMGAGS